MELDVVEFVPARDFGSGPNDFDHHPSAIDFHSRFGGIGDNLIASAVLPGLRAKYGRVEVITQHPQHVVFENNPYVDKLSVYDTASVSSRSTPSFLVEPGQVAIFSGLIESNRPGSSVSATHPASGWQADSIDTGMRGYAHDGIIAAGNTVGTVTATSAGNRGIFGVVFGTADAAAPPLTSTFIGWGNPIF